MSKKLTRYIKVDSANPGQQEIGEAAAVLRDGGLVAFPTETVYGLGANALAPAAVAGIFRAKGRPADNPLIVHIADINQVEELSNDITVPARRLMEAFWPGPLTLVLSKTPAVPDEVTAGLDTVAVRMPDHPVALSLLRASGVPVAAPSANTSGTPSPTSARHVLDDLEGKVDVVVDGGACRVGVESTVIDVSTEPPAILRPGGVSREEIEGIIGHVEIDPALNGGSPDEAPRAPGMKYRHYSPKAAVILVAGDDYPAIHEKVWELLRRYRGQYNKIGILASAETARAYCADIVFPVGSRASLATVAQNLFYGLRFMDEEGADLVIAEGYPEEGIGAAIMNRLKKAAGDNIVYVEG